MNKLDINSFVYYTLFLVVLVYYYLHNLNKKKLGIPYDKKKRLMKRSHLYHIVDPSPWPLLVTFSLVNGVFCSLMFFFTDLYNNAVIFKIYIGFLFIVYLWFGNIVREASKEGRHTRIVQKSIKLGMLLFIISEVMFFFCFFWAFFHLSLAPASEIGSVWPPYGIQIFDYKGIPYINTIILLLSGASITWAHNVILVKKKKNVSQALLSIIITITLAGMFTGLQWLEYCESYFHIEDGGYGSIFFLATGFHGIHVVLGTIFLIVSYIRIASGHFNKQHHLGFELAVWYWHFVDVVWLFLYFFVYCWGTLNLCNCGLEGCGLEYSVEVETSLEDIKD